MYSSLYVNLNIRTSLQGVRSSSVSAQSGDASRVRSRRSVRSAEFDGVGAADLSVVMALTVVGMHSRPTASKRVSAKTSFHLTVTEGR